MYNNIASKINPVIKFHVLLILVIMIFLSKSIYLMLFLTTLLFICIVSLYDKLDWYIKEFFSFFSLLVCFTVLYIFAVDDSNLILIIYKSLMIYMFLILFRLSINISDLFYIIVSVFMPLKIFNIKIDKAVYYVFISYFLILNFFESKIFLRNLENNFLKKKPNLFSEIVSRLIYSINEVNKLNETLKIDMPQIKLKKINWQSIIILFIFLILLIICIIKEVIL